MGFLFGKTHQQLLVIVILAHLAYVNCDSCVQCNSATDTKCATNPDKFMAKECTNSTSKCFTRVLDGHTIRGCASELDNATASNCNNEMECLICSFTEGCNRQVFPTHRASCLQCVGNVTDPCATDTFARPQICPIYKLGDSCYVRNDGLNKSTSFQRGCLSSAHANKLCLEKANCYICEGAGCNMVEVKDVPLARDSATTVAVGFSVTLVMLGSMVAHFS